MKVALGAAKGLAFLHSAQTKVIYRDFKTANILLDSVCGFGFAKFSLYAFILKETFILHNLWLGSINLWITFFL